MKLINHPFLRSASFCSRILILTLEFARSFFKRLGLRNIAGIGWIDFACHIPWIRKLPFVLKLLGYNYTIFLFEMPLCYSVFGTEYEKSETKLIRRLTPSVLIDVGAHVGYYTMLAHKLGSKKIIAIEPDVRVFRILNRVIEANKLGNIITINRAAWDKSGVILKLHLSTKAGHSSVFSFNLERGFSGTIALVKTITLDELSRALSLDKIDLVKIDVEGAEFNVLLGSDEIISRFRPVFLVEVKDVNKENVFNFFRTRMYKFLGPFSYGENYLFIPEERDMGFASYL